MPYYKKSLVTLVANFASENMEAKKWDDVNQELHIHQYDPSEMKVKLRCC